MFSRIRKALARIVRPNNPKDEDSARREFILNVLVVGSTALSLVCVGVSVAFSHIYYAYRNQKAHSTPLPILLALVAFFSLIYLLSRSGRAKIAAYAFIGLYFSLSWYTSYRWGVYVPQALLIFSLVIVMSGVLIGTRFSFILTLASSAGIILMFKLQESGYLNPDLYWRKTDVDSGDMAVYLVTLFVISVVAWLSNRETEKSLYRARRSEAELKEERDMLEIRVEERTRELKKAQYDKMREIHRFAEFGRISSGLFHDMTNYLTALSLNLEMAKEKRTNGAGEARNYLDRAMKTSEKMEGFVENIQKQLKHQDKKSRFSLVQEIEQVIQILSHKAKKSGVETVFLYGEDCFLLGNSFKFSQAIANVVSNAIDSYAGKAGSIDRKVMIRLERTKGSAILSVQDRGCGISKENLEKIFDPFFTTKKSEEGTGIGLSTVSEIVKKDFSGRIEVKSEPGEGTDMRISFPITE